jgi:hypothetical protein
MSNPITKRLRVDEKKVLHDAIASAKLLFKDDILREGVTVRETDLTFSLRLRRNAAIRKRRIDEIVKIANSVRESYIKLEYNDGTFTISMENKYPAAGYERRAERAKCEDEYWRHLDLDEKDAKIATARVMWSCELSEITAFDSNCIVCVDPILKRLKIVKDESN